MTDLMILDTSWLLELYQVPGDSKKERYQGVLLQARAANEGQALVTIPVLFEFANHIVRVRDGNHRHQLIEKYSEAVSTSLEVDKPWKVVRSKDDVLLTTRDFIEMSRRFVATSGPAYSLADISIIDLAQRLQERHQVVRILAFDKQLEAYAG